ncbi:uncharacterized protein DS421_6g192650 [Arachis hypogaea]|nr:uncharacterized protein DS421_6g192650 [Arachis hypogaea]
MTQASIKHVIDFMEEFVWRPYVGIIIPTKLHAHLDVCDTSPLWQHKPYQLTHIAIIFGEYSTMTGAEFMTNGYNNGLVHRIIRDVAEVLECHSSASAPATTAAATSVAISASTSADSSQHNLMQCFSHFLVITHSYLSTTAQIMDSRAIIAHIIAISLITDHSITITTSTTITVILDSSSQTFPYSSSHFS